VPLTQPQVVHYLLCHGSGYMVDALAERFYTFTRLEECFRPQPMSPSSAARADNNEAREAQEGCSLVRAKASKVLSLLRDANALAAARAEAERTAGRFVGHSSGFGSDGAGSTVHSAGMMSRSGPSSPSGVTDRSLRPFSLGGASSGRANMAAIETGLPSRAGGFTTALDDYEQERDAVRASKQRASSAGTYAPPQPVGSLQPVLMAPPAPPYSLQQRAQPSWDPFVEAACAAAAAPAPVVAQLAAVKSVDPFATLLIDLDDSLELGGAFKQSTDAQPLCADAAAAWSFDTLSAPTLQPAPPSGSKRAPDAVDALLDDARKRFAQISIPDTPWGPGPGTPSPGAARGGEPDDWLSSATTPTTPAAGRSLLDM